MSPQQRLRLIQRNIAKKTNDMEQFYESYDFNIWWVEHEFGFVIDKDFPYAKFQNLLNEKNIKRYNTMMNNSNNGKPLTMG